MALVNFNKGLYNNLPATISEGNLYVTTDERAIYFDYDNEHRIRLGDYITVANLDALPSTASTDALYYAEQENVLARFDGSNWIQINPDTTYEFAQGDTNGTFKFKSSKDSSFTEIAIKGLKAVAFSGAASDITIKDEQGLLSSTTLEDALVELYQSIQVGGTGSAVTVEKDEVNSDGVATRYIIKQGGIAVPNPIEIPIVDIPKDMVIKSGAVVEDYDEEHPGSWMRIELQNTTDIIWISVASLIEYVTAGADTATVHVSVSTDHKVTANVIDGSIGETQLSSSFKQRITNIENSIETKIENVLSWNDF